MHMNLSRFQDFFGLLYFPISGLKEKKKTFKRKVLCNGNLETDL